MSAIPSPSTSMSSWKNIWLWSASRFLEGWNYSKREISRGRDEGLPE